MAQYNPNQLRNLYASEIAQMQRFVVKIGTYVLTNQQTGKLDEKKIEELVDQAAGLYKKNAHIAIVTSGAVGAGKAEAGVKYEIQHLAMKQALAAIGQPKLMALYDKFFREHGILTGQFLASYDDLNNPVHCNNFVDTVRVLRDFGGIPIINENDPFSTDELETSNGNGSKSFGDNDLLSVMVAETLDAQVLFLLSKEKGLMDDCSQKIDIVSYGDLVAQYATDSTSNGGTGGMKSKLDSIVRATEAGIFVVLLSGLESRGIDRILCGEPAGTLFLPKNFKYNV